MNIPVSSVRAGIVSRMSAAMIGQARKTLHCPPLPRLDGRLALVTGATGGIGAEIARGLARRGAELILPCRSAERGRETLQVLRAELGDSCRVHLVDLDLVDLASVAPAVTAIAGICGGRPIDIVVENAGVWPMRYAVSPQGYEIAFGVNVLAHFDLRRRLLAADLLPSARVIVLTGDIYMLQSECTPDYRWSGPIGGMLAYCRSKLGNLWIASELARRSPELSVFAVHPGVVATNLGGAAGTLGNAIKRRLMISPAQGAQIALICATQDGLPSGGYYHNTNGLMQLPAADPALNHAAAQTLWDTCVTLSGHA